MKTRHETFRREYVRCGKPGCRKCPHGPYWYAYWREGKKTRKRYLGKTLPHGEDGGESPQVGERMDDIHNPRLASLALAVEILGFGYACTFTEAQAAYRKLVLQHHPDRGGDINRFRRINSAWAFLCNFKGW